MSNKTKQAELQSIEQAKGRPLLHWAGKKPLEKIEYFPAQEKEVYGEKNAKEFNKLFWGDNLQVLAHLLKEYRGRIDLIYIDPPFGAGVDYFKKIKLRGEKIKGQYSIFEEKQYANVFDEDYYLQFHYERLLLMRELLADTGSIFVRMDYHFGHYMKVILDEVFGRENFRNEIVLKRGYVPKGLTKQFITGTDSLFLYCKNFTQMVFTGIKKKIKESERQWISLDMPGERKTYELQVRHFFGKPWLPPKGQHWGLPQERIDEFQKKNEVRINNGRSYIDTQGNKVQGMPEYLKEPELLLDTNWTDIKSYETHKTGYPTENAEIVLKRVITSVTQTGDLVADLFCGSGTTPVVAQELGRRWLACDINLGAIQTTAKRVNQTIQEQLKEQPKLMDDFKGVYAFKVYNVNDYDIFKNELEAKAIVIQMYGIEPIKRSYFDGVLDSNFVKVMPMNRVLNKLDVKTALKNIEDKIGSFTVKRKSKSGEPVYEEGVLIICSDMEFDVADFLKKENKTGVKVETRDIQTDKKNLIFKKKPEARIDVKAKGKKLHVEIKEFYSPILMRKLEMENEKMLKKEYQAKVEDFRQIVDSVAVDVDYSGNLFNAEISDVPAKKELVKAKYEWTYAKKGKYTVAVKIVDVLGEEYFETFKVTA